MENRQLLCRVCRYHRSGPTGGTPSEKDQPAAGAMSPNCTLTGQPAAAEYLRSSAAMSAVAATDSSSVSAKWDPSGDTEVIFTAGSEACSSLANSLSLPGEQVADSTEMLTFGNRARRSLCIESA